ncbi:MAG: cellulose synthase operon protein YhjQ [Herminiimonas sp.]|nr:cellulose synthase operon protein YhjQ [Herminiimonas sp.]
MRIVAIIGACGGAGSTTVAAHLASALVEQNKPVLGFDFCPTNVLRLHFGAALAEQPGFVTSLGSARPWQDACYTSASGVRFLPFGALPDDMALEYANAWMQASPRWFAEALASLDLAPDTMIICDCPLLPAALRSQALAVADLVIVVSSPDPLALASATHLARQLHDDGDAAGRICTILLNRFEAARRLDRDIQLLLQRQQGHLASPVIIHRDESLREALAHKQTVFDYAPATQAAHEFAALATWVIARTGQRMATT